MSRICPTFSEVWAYLGKMSVAVSTSCYGPHRSYFHTVRWSSTLSVFARFRPLWRSSSRLPVDPDRHPTASCREPGSFRVEMPFQQKRYPWRIPLDRNTMMLERARQDLNHADSSWTLDGTQNRSTSASFARYLLGSCMFRGPRLFTMSFLTVLST
jgi:hypothetical protein